MVKKFARKFSEGKKCVYCGKYGFYRLRDKRVKCKHCRRAYSLLKLRKDLEILYLFSLELSARKTAKTLGLSYKPVYDRFGFYRELILQHCKSNFMKLSGELELDETYFGGKRKGKRGRGAFNKQAVFGVLERGGKAYIVPVPDVKKATLMEEIKNKTYTGSVFYTDCFKSYAGLRYYGKHKRINKKYAFAKGKNHINGVESLWAFIKERMNKFHGVKMDNYYSYLKEMEFRFNNRDTNIYKQLFHITYNEFGTETT